MSGLREEFERFHAANPHVYTLFERFTFDAINAGRTRFGAKAVFERIRWFTTVETNSKDDLKLNNNYTAFYARLFEARWPYYAGLFEKRTAVADEPNGYRFAGDGQGAFL